jgi:hypothetical protein
MTNTDLILIVGAADIGVHLGITLAVGVYLNKMARKEVEQAVTKVADGLASRFPILAGFMNPQGQPANLLSSIVKGINERV